MPQEVYEKISLCWLAGLTAKETYELTKLDSRLILSIYFDLRVRIASCK